MISNNSKRDVEGTLLNGKSISRRGGREREVTNIKRRHQTFFVYFHRLHIEIYERWLQQPKQCEL